LGSGLRSPVDQGAATSATLASSDETSELLKQRSIIQATTEWDVLECSQAISSGVNVDGCATVGHYRKSSMMIFVRASAGRNVWTRPIVEVLFDNSIVACFSQQTYARDVEIAYAISVEGKVDNGKVERCGVGELCRIVSNDTGLAIFINLINPDGRRAYIRVWGEVGCCYFRDGERSVSVDLHMALHRFDIYRDRGRRRNELTQNQKIGEVYLGFKEFN
jgi:hypothetical protein